MSKYIHLIERNQYGAWVIYGAIGQRRYIGYTKAQAIAIYNQTARCTIDGEPLAKLGRLVKEV
jgi:hypothetical protein